MFVSVFFSYSKKIVPTLVYSAIGYFRWFLCWAEFSWKQIKTQKSVLELCNEIFNIQDPRPGKDASKLAGEMFLSIKSMSFPTPPIGSPLLTNQNKQLIWTCQCDSVCRSSLISLITVEEAYIFLGQTCWILCLQKNFHRDHISFLEGRKYGSYL